MFTSRGEHSLLFRRIEVFSPGGDDGVIIVNQRAILNSTPGPKGEICTQGGMFTPLFTPRGEHSLLFGRVEWQTEIFTPRGQNSPLGVKVCP
jgi:hypothetical protein